MTIREMIDAMLAGKTLIRPSGATAYYDPDDADCAPWVYVGGGKARIGVAWHYPDWSIKPEHRVKGEKCEMCDSTGSLIPPKEAAVGEVKRYREIVQSIQSRVAAVGPYLAIKEVAQEIFALETQLQKSRKQIFGLWRLLDDIDTLDDMCRENDSAFRSKAYRKQRRRFDITSEKEYEKLYKEFADSSQPEATDE